MYSIVAERPFMLVLILLGLAAASGFFWMQSGRREPAILAGLFLILIPIGIFVEKSIVTDRESITAAIMEIAGHLEVENHDSVIGYIDPSAPNVLRTAKTELPKYEFDSVRVGVGGIREIKVSTDRDPPEATAEFMINVIVSSRNGAFSKVQAPRLLTVHFRKSEAAGRTKWLILGYKHGPPVGKSDPYATSSGQIPEF